MLTSTHGIQSQLETTRDKLQAEVSDAFQRAERLEAELQRSLRHLVAFVANLLSQRRRGAQSEPKTRLI